MKQEGWKTIKRCWFCNGYPLCSPPAGICRRLYCRAVCLFVRACVGVFSGTLGAWDMNLNVSFSLLACDISYS